MTALVPQDLRKQIGNIAEFEAATRKLRASNLAEPEASATTRNKPTEDPVGATAANGITSAEYPPLGQEAPRQNARHGAAQNGGTAPPRQAHAQQESASAANAMVRLLLCALCITYLFCLCKLALTMHNCEPQHHTVTAASFVTKARGG